MSATPPPSARRFKLSTVMVLLAVLAAACGSTTSAGPTLESAAQPAPTVVTPAVEETTVDTLPETSTTTTQVATTTTTAAPTALECAAEVELEVRLGQLMFPVVVQSELAAASALAERGLLGGVVVLGAPDATIADDIADLQSRAMVSPAIVAVDEEGGRVQRLDRLVGAVPSARSVARELSVAEARSLALAHAERIGELGFTMNLAPVVDLDNGVFIGDRSYGADPDSVVDYAFATADGILAAGLTPVVKHFPGHGRGEDSHTGLPTLPELDVLRGDDLVPFVQAIERGDLPIMVGHLVVPDLTNGKPATLSPEAIDGLLRTELGFDGLVMTDALNMDAISDTTNNADAAEQALVAGVDLVMLGSLAETALVIEQLIDAVTSGRVSEASVNASFLRVLEQRGLEICDLPPGLQPAIGCQPDVGACPAG